MDHAYCDAFVIVVKTGQIGFCPDGGKAAFVDGRAIGLIGVWHQWRPNSLITASITESGLIP